MASAELRAIVRSPIQHGDFLTRDVTLQVCLRYACRMNPGNRRSICRAAIAFVATALAGCITGPPLVCQAGAQPGVMAELYFGRNIGARLGVNEAEFRRFLDEEITPRFPDGLTILDGRGQYRGSSDASIVREPSKILMVAIPQGTATDMRLSEIAAAYKLRFRQQSVLTVVRAACVGF